MTPAPIKDLIVLVPCLDIERTIVALLSRHNAFGIKPLTSDVRRHIERDSGCFLRAESFLRAFVRQYSRALVMLDRVGSGAEAKTRIEIEADIEWRLSRNGWDHRAAAVAIDPELETWVWSTSRVVDEALGWAGKTPDLRSWLFSKGLVSDIGQKPHNPKRAVAEAVRIAQKSHSAATYELIARRASFRACNDPAFIKLRQVLRDWFGTDLPLREVLEQE